MLKLHDQTEHIRKSLLEMMHLVRSQIVKSRECLFSSDHELAEEIRLIERRVNGYELSIDKECENALALLNPVAVDLRFILSALKINSTLERIGDHANGIATFVSKDSFDGKVHTKALEKLQLLNMFDTVISMLGDAITSYETENTQIARWVFGKDKTLNELDRNNIQNFIDLINEGEPLTSSIIHLGGISKKLERIGDLTKNIAEEVLFFIEAKTPKHEGKTEL